MIRSEDWNEAMITIEQLSKNKLAIQDGIVTSPLSISNKQEGENWPLLKIETHEQGASFSIENGLSLAITPKGAVGIGTSNPRTKLEIDGYLTKKEVAFAVYGKDHISSGSDQTLVYEGTTSNIGDSWDGTKFTTPVEGVYFFNVMFARSAYEHGSTADDIFMRLRLNGEILEGYAWAGEGDGMRASASFTTLLQLREGDIVDTYVTSDGGLKRFLPIFHFSGYRI